MENWKAKAVAALQNLNKDRMAVSGLAAQILEKNADMIAITDMGYGQPDDPEGVPSPRLRKLLEEKQTLEARHAALMAHVEQADRSLAALGDKPREVLKTFYLLGLSKAEAVATLERKQHITRSEVYRRRDIALWEFAYRMGWIEVEGE